MQLCVVCIWMWLVICALPTISFLIQSKIVHTISRQCIRDVRPPNQTITCFGIKRKKKRPTTTENHRMESKTRIECTGQEHTVDDGTLRHVRTWCDSIRKSSTSKMSMVCCCVPSTGGGATNSVLRYFFFLINKQSICSGLYFGDNKRSAVQNGVKELK